jgi:hypothetical protein
MVRSEHGNEENKGRMQESSYDPTVKPVRNVRDVLRDVIRDVISVVIRDATQTQESSYDPTVKPVSVRINVVMQTSCYKNVAPLAPQHAGRKLSQECYTPPAAEQQAF